MNKKITFWSILRENAVLLLMYLLGAVLFWLIQPVFALAYLGYAIFSNALFMAWVCPCCPHYSLATCPAGFHILSGGIFKRKTGWTYQGQFRKGVLVIGLGWFLPPSAALYILVRDFSWGALALGVIFCLVGFWWLPSVSKQHCDSCDNLECPRRPVKRSAAT
jgi:hypothetical protein